MRVLLLFGLAAALAGCVTGGLPTIAADVESTSLANVRSLNLFTPSLPGELGTKFNSLLENKLTEKLSNVLNPGARWTLTVVNVEYTTPHHEQKFAHYKLALEVELVDVAGKRGWHAIVGTPEVEAKPSWNEQQIREHLVNAAADALVLKLPLGRIELGEEKLK